jgi:hypothetical protein
LILFDSTHFKTGQSVLFKRHLLQFLLQSLFSLLTALLVIGKFLLSIAELFNLGREFRLGGFESYL